ncbi:fructose-bisphosphate aldolase, class II [Rhodovulum sulfidophilum]|uniref:Fructose-bisphosphate aldolase, class II n=1 Tax=Rhodovulum sulfidophilum TaxID=35806 RepID=A0A0D6AYT7_RHOSU|nr:fructose-bisphosphate aldolase, class II [Rhodovulum sulfidophilum]
MVMSAAMLKTQIIWRESSSAVQEGLKRVRSQVMARYSRCNVGWGATVAGWGKRVAAPMRADLIGSQAK